MAQLVGAILEAEGFVVQVSPPGADGGVDILAGRGLFGMDSPRVVVQVKSEPKVSDTVVAQLHGAVTRNSADQGLLVAMGGVTKPAEHQLVGQKFRIAVWDSERLQRAIFDNYEALPRGCEGGLAAAPRMGARGVNKPIALRGNRAKAYAQACAGCQIPEKRCRTVAIHRFVSRHHAHVSADSRGLVTESIISGLWVRVPGVHHRRKPR